LDLTVYPARDHRAFDRHISFRKLPHVGLDVQSNGCIGFRLHARKMIDHDAQVRHLIAESNTSFNQVRSRICGIRDPEIQHLHCAVGLDLDIGGLQIAMNNAFLMRGL